MSSDVFRLHQMVSAINHNFMVWDIDELPLVRFTPDFNGSATTSLGLLLELFQKKCRRVFASSDPERAAGAIR